MEISYKSVFFSLKTCFLRACATCSELPCPPGPGNNHTKIYEDWPTHKYHGLELRSLVYQVNE